MNRNRAAALLMLPVGVWAQTSASLYGVVDLNLLYGRGSVASRLQLGPGGMDSPRIGFSGAEDLGGGYKASFTMEADLLPDSGVGVRSNLDNQPVPNLLNAQGTQGLTMNRIVFVGLQAPWGRFRTGRDYTPTFAVHALYDPAGAAGLLGSQSAYSALTVTTTPIGVRASNSFAFALGELRSGPLLHASYALGENPSGSGASRHDGGFRGVRLAYTAPPVDVAVGYGVYKISSVGDIRELVVGGKFDIGPVGLWLIRVRDTTGKANNMHGSMVGLSYPHGAWHYRASWSKGVQRNFAGADIGTTSKVGAGASYSFSKRTSVYANIAYTRNSHGATSLPVGGIGQTAPNHSGMGREVGLRTTF